MYNRIYNLNSPKLTPLGFLFLSAVSHRIISKLAGIAVITPLFFMLTKIFSLQLISEQSASAIVKSAANLWPILKLQYAFLLRAGSTLDASNYVVFVVFISVLIAGAVSATGVFYIKTIRYTKKLALHDVYMLLLTAWVIQFELYVDEPSVDPRPFFDLYVDNMGLYYLRQWALMMVVAMSLIVAVAAVLTVVSSIVLNFLEKGQNRSR